MIKLKYIAFEITDSCNLDCVYCYNIWKTDKVKGAPFNSYSNAIKTLEKLFSIAEIDYITFTGGEPFLAERFNEVVLYCIMAGKKVSIISNGTQANQQKFKELIKLGVELFELPIHSLQPEIHNKMVQLNGSWEKSTASIKTIMELGGKVVPVIVITKHNVNKIAETLDYIASLGCSRIMLNRYNIGGKGCENPLIVSATADELRNAFSIANEKVKELNLKITANVCTPICLLNPSDYPLIGFGHCSFNVLERPITLDINGNVRLCNHSPIVAGNIFETDLSKILYSDYTTEWETSIPEFCKPCSQWSTCKGGCRAATEQCTGRLDIEDPIIKALNINSIFKKDKSETYEIVWQNGLCGFKNSIDEMITPYKYDDVSPFNKAGISRVSINGKQGILYKSGKEIVPLKYDLVLTFNEGLLLVKLDNKWGYVNADGLEVIPLKYDDAFSFHEGLANVKLNNKWGYIDKNGIEVIPFIYNDALCFIDGYAVVKRKNQWFFIDKTGNVLVELDVLYDTIGFFKDGLAPVKKNDKWGFIDKTGRQIIPTIYVGDGPFGEILGPKFINGLAKVKLDDKMGYIDINGYWIIDSDETTELIKTRSLDEFKKEIDIEKLGAYRNENGYLYVALDNKPSKLIADISKSINCKADLNNPVITTFQHNNGEEYNVLHNLKHSFKTSD